MKYVCAIKVRYVRLNILEANNPTVEEFRVLPPVNDSKKGERE